MPLFEYYCPDCQSSFETLLAYDKTRAPVECERCHGTHTWRKVSRFVAMRGGDGMLNDSDDFGGETGGGCACGGQCSCGGH
jgi:putative FmdB family regulatory protein